MALRDAPGTKARAMSEPLDPTFCPLCGQPNACALAASPGVPAAECWCAALRFDDALLARIPAASVGRACICLRCQRAAAEAPDPA
jgi:hypothetical protein